MTRRPAESILPAEGEVRKGTSLGARISRLLLLGTAAFFLWLAFRNTPLKEIVVFLALVRPWQIGVILLINVLFHVLMGMRWWFLARADVGPVRFLDLVLVRLGAFGISYITPGPQLGGEPLQIQFLRRRYRASFARAAATVIMDRLVELLAGFIVMILGISALLQEGLLQDAALLPPGVLIAIAVMMAWPAVHIVLLRRRSYPVSALIAVFPIPKPLMKIRRLIRAAEHLAGRFCQRRPRAVLSSLGVSVLAAGLAVMEYALIMSFLGIRLSPTQTMAGWTAGWLSFAIPLPGALGALEASQIVALGSFGYGPAAALGATLLLRARDLLFGGAGFLLAARSIHLELSRKAPLHEQR